MTAAPSFYSRAMVGVVLKRPSVLVGAWTVIVVAVFVARGDLRIAATPSQPFAGGSVPGSSEPRSRDHSASIAPVVVRAPANGRAAPTVTRRGRVFDAMGFLVVGAEVVAMDRPPVRTDADGSFQLDLAAAGTADVLVRADGLRPVWLRTSEGSPDALALQLVPSAPWDQPPAPPLPLPALRAEGHARGVDGQPLAGAFVTVRGGGVWARTDDIGRFVLPLPSTTATLLVHAPDGGALDTGFAGASQPVVSPREHGAVPVPDLIAEAGAVVRGIVRDARGQPAASVPVWVRGDGLQRIVETGYGGEFRIGGLLHGRYDARPFAFRGAIGVTQEIVLDGQVVDVDLHLVAADEVRLRVVDEGGGPVGGVHVASSIGGVRRGVARTDGEGFVSVPVAAQTDFEVRLPPAFASLPVRRFDDEPPTLVVALQ